MEELEKLTSFFEGGPMPEGHDAKALDKLARKYKKWKNPRVVRAYIVRSASCGDYRFCVYALPFNGQEIDEQTLLEIKAATEQLEVGHIRYDGGFCYFRRDENGNHWKEKEDDKSGVQAISDYFDGVVLLSRITESSNKIPQLDCHYAVLGLDKQPDYYEFELIPNHVIGVKECQVTFPVSIDDVQTESPAEAKYRSAVKVLSIIITIGFLIWYFLLR